MEKDEIAQFKSVYKKAADIASTEVKKIEAWQNEKKNLRPRWINFEQGCGNTQSISIEDEQLIAHVEIYGFEGCFTIDVPVKLGFADEIIAVLEYRMAEEAKHLRFRNEKAKQEKEANDRAEYERLKAKFEGGN